jgi:hypothetical protein
VIAGILLGMSDAEWTQFDRTWYYLAGSWLMAPNKCREIINILGMQLQEAVSMLRIPLPHIQ